MKYSQSTSSAILPSLRKDYQFFTLRTHFFEDQNYFEPNLLLRKTTINNHDPNEEVPDNVKQQHPKQHTSKENIILHYTHEKRFAKSKTTIHRFWQHIFPHIPIQHAKIIVGHKNRRNTTKETVSKRPKLPI